MHTRDKEEVILGLVILSYMFGAKKGREGCVWVTRKCITPPGAEL
jgi:hypothetical protein